MKRFAILAGVALATMALTGCGEKKDVDVKNASPGDVAAKIAGSDMHFTPGAWETKVQTADLEIAGMPPEAAAQMKQMMAKGNGLTFRTCLTPEKAANPGKDFFKGGDKSCTYKDFTMGDGKLSGTIECKGEDSPGGTMTMTGSYTADSYTMDVNMTGNEDGKAMKMHVVSTAHHVGDCQPGDEKD